MVNVSFKWPFCGYLNKHTPEITHVWTIIANILTAILETAHWIQSIIELVLDIDGSITYIFLGTNKAIVNTAANRQAVAIFSAILETLIGQNFYLNSSKRTGGCHSGGHAGNQMYIWQNPPEFQLEGEIDISNE